MLRGSGRARTLLAGILCAAVLLLLPGRVEAAGCNCSGTCDYNGRCLECRFCAFCCSHCALINCEECWEALCAEDLQGETTARNGGEPFASCATAAETSHQGRPKVLRVELLPVRS